MDRKELALAVNFGKAPKEIQQAAKDAEAIVKDILKCQATIADQQARLEKLEVQAGVAEKNLRRLLNDWDPSTVSAAGTSEAK